MILFRLIFVLVLSFIIPLTSPSAPKLHEINDENWTDIATGEWLIEFMAYWCKNCKNLQPEWDKLVVSASKINVNVGRIDVLKAPVITEKFSIKRIPSIFYIKDGQIRPYSGKMKSKHFINFIQRGTWKEVKPLSLWTHPALFPINVLSQYQNMKDGMNVYALALEDYGIPVWTFYSILTIVTLICSVFLGKMSWKTFSFMKNMKLTFRKQVPTINPPEDTEELLDYNETVPEEDKEYISGDSDNEEIEITNI